MIDLESQFDSFIQEANIEILSIDSVLPEKVFLKYFEGSPPFGKGKKKDEFPDAFSIAALEKKAEVEGKKIYVVSGDEDWEKVGNTSKNLIFIKNVDKFLEQIICEQNSKEIGLCYDVFERVTYTIEREVSQQFIEFGFSLNTDFAGVEWGSECVTEVQVDGFNINDKSIISINNSNSNNISVVFELKIDISFMASISCNSLEIAIWDKEDKKYYSAEFIKDDVHQEITVPVEVKIIFCRDNSYNLVIDTVERVDLDPNKSIGTIKIGLER